MHLQCYVVNCSPNHCCYVNTTIPSFFIALSEGIALSNRKVLCVATVMQHQVPFVFLPSCKIFRTAVNSINIIKWQVKFNPVA